MNTEMTPEALEAQRKYKREWSRKYYAAHPEKRREAQARHWQKVADRAKAAAAGNADPQ